MLRELRIRNLAIIDDVTIAFENALNVLTGETGAGKSIIIDALSLALGERASGEQIRSGKKEAVIDAFFEISGSGLSRPSRRLLDELGVEAGEGLHLKRIISAQGKSRSYINDSMVTLQTLKRVSSDMIDVHGQYEHQSLLARESQLEMLDAYAGLHRQRGEYKRVFDTSAALQQKIARLNEGEQERARRVDMLRFQANEINAAALEEGEDERLDREFRVLNSAGRLSELANSAYETLYGADSSCMTGLNDVVNSLQEISSIDPSAEEAHRTARDALPLLEEAAYFLRDYKGSLDFSPGRLNEVQERLALISRLKEKYGHDIKAVLDHRDRSEKELEDLENPEEELNRLSKELEGIRTELTDKARSLSQKRKVAARKIEKEVMKTLAKLSMPDTVFSISLTQEKGSHTLDGLKADAAGTDVVEYLISPNVGEQPRPLAKIASGGELSRIMLSLKSAMAGVDRIPVLIFDEIDAGIGGKAAEAVGRKLKEIAAGHQTICITHLPQIASSAETHLKIEKKVSESRTVVSVSRVKSHERAREISRMLSGDGTEVSIKLAREMLRKNR